VCGQNVEFVNVKPGGILTTGICRVNIGLDRGAVICWGMDVSELPGELRQTKVKILV
jgi:hypothetical protein